jgi:hypothetical protein
MNKLASSLCCLAVAALLPLATPSSAAAVVRTYTGYVCATNLGAPSAWTGDYGSVHFTLYSRPFCQGSWLAGVATLSPNHTAMCSDHQTGYNTYSEAQMGHMFDKLSDAADRGQRVVATANDCGWLLELTFYGVH